VLAHLKADAATAGIPVVAVSANAMADDIATMLAAGARAYLTKPVELERLTSLVRQHAATA
jgi:CheY-like chemotaxis protein